MMATLDLDARVERVRAELAALPRRPEVRELLRLLDELEHSDLELWERVGPRNELLRRLGHDGVDHHRYRLSPPLSEEQVVAYERRNEIRLPEEYRVFLTRVAGGGAGPSLYRLLPLDPEAVHRALHRPFPFRPDALPGADWDVEHGFWESGDGPFSRELWPGAIFITDEGCTFYKLLVVTGPYRGRIVHIDRDCNAWPEFDPAPDFLSWYEDWLFHRRRGTRPWREHDALARIVLEAGDGPGAEDAVRACFYLAAPYPCTQQPAVDVLAEGVRGGAGPAGRARAVWVLGEMANRRRELAPARHLIRPALSDPDPAVRAMAIEYADAEVDVIRGFLDDPAPEVVGAALVRLARDGDHRLDVLRRLLASPSATARIAGAEAGLRAYREDGWRKRPDIDALGSAVGDLFLPAMGDPEPRVRAAAIVVLFVREPERGVAAFLAASHDPEEEVRFRAAQALRREAPSDPAIRARLRSLAEHDGSLAIRIEARSQLPDQ